MRNMKEPLAPIVLFVYNRPIHTMQTVEGLLQNPEAKDSIIYIFADGPKKNAKQSDLEKIKETRSYIHTIKGFKDIIIKESDCNKGLANSTIEGCTNVINQHGKMIMIEDDDIPTKYFLSYVNRCLEKYANDESIWCVSGYVDNKLLPAYGDDDLFLVRRPSSWGFGTWKRCWDKVIWDVPTLKGLFKHRDIIRGYNKWAGIDSSEIMFGLFKGIYSSWSIRYNLGAYLNNSLTILPNKSLIKNIGTDGSGTHCEGQELKLQYFDRDVIIPEEIKYDQIRNTQLMKSFIPHSFGGKLLYYLGLYNWVKIHFIYKV